MSYSLLVTGITAIALTELWIRWVKRRLDIVLVRFSTLALK